MSTGPTGKDQKSFWERQYEGPPTAWQIAFDLAFGVALPLLCLYFDPIVFRASALGQPLLGSYMVVGLVAIFLGLVSLPGWIILRRPASLFAGLLAGSAIFSTSLGFVLLPYSLMGLAFFI